MAQLGYARVSTPGQRTEPQEDALRQAGCDRIWVEKASGTIAERVELKALLGYARKGDVIVATKLDRVARSVAHLVNLAGYLEQVGVGLKILDQGIDTTTVTGRLIFHILAAIGEFERDLIRDRTQIGLAAAKARGHLGGRPRTVTPERLEAAKRLVAGGQSIKAAAEAMGVSRSTLHRYLQKED